MHRRLALWAVLSALFVTGVLAQGPIRDRVTVNLPYTVTVQDKTLEPGEYIIQESNSVTESPVLQIYRDGGLVFETTAMTIDVVDKKTPEETSVVLQKVGDDYYLNKMWIVGKNYGYEVALPEKVKERQQEMQETRVPGKVEHGDTLSREAK